GEPNRRRAAADLLHGDDVLEIAEPGPAIVLLDGDAVQAERAKLRPEGARELVAAVDIGRQRSDLVAGEGAHAGAQPVGRLTELEVGRGVLVGNHLRPPGRVAPSSARRSCRLSWLAPRRAGGKECLKARGRARPRPCVSAAGAAAGYARPGGGAPAAE